MSAFVAPHTRPKPARADDDGPMFGRGGGGGPSSVAVRDDRGADKGSCYGTAIETTITT